MTEHDDDLKALRSAMTKATPAPDPELRRQTLAQADKAFAAVHATKRGGIWSNLRLPRFNRAWTGLATGATAVIAVGVLVLPSPDMTPAPVSVSAPDAERPVQPPPAPMAAERMMAPSALSNRAEIASTTLAPDDPWSVVATALAEGQFPAPDSIDRAALLNTLATRLPASPPAHYAVPWDAETVLFDSGDRNDQLRFRLVPSAGVVPAAPDDEMTMVIAVAGFVVRLSAGQDLNGWGFADALRLAETTSPHPRDRHLRDLMGLATEIAEN